MSFGGRVVVIGLGYVGLPLAVALARNFDTIGFDIDDERLRELREGRDHTGEIDEEQLRNVSLKFSADPAECAGADVYIVTVPTPVDRANRPDLNAVLAATRIVASLIDSKRRPTIVYESTVYPGVTEEVCGPEIERLSGLKRGRDFRLGYSPERINPGDCEHSIDKITKVIAGEDCETLDQLAEIYGSLTSAGVFRSASIKAAEAAKAIENAQRDINIAFINEVTQIFSKIGVSVWDVLAAAKTKWNFLDFEPGLVGGNAAGPGGRAPNAMDDILIEELELGVRSYNCLKRAGIQTVGDLVSKTESELNAIPNFGKKSIDEVIETLHARGLNLRGE